ncbi:MAG: hypothetical protein QOD72_2271 [Acidimicrobiaceae bacterium]|nr:hypothetical protein [Acidimicrobiaceae bacterium]
MNKPHNRDDVFPAGIDDGVEREIQQIFVTAQSPGTAEELASEASVVAAMTHGLRHQRPSSQTRKPRPPRSRAVASRAAKVAMVSGLAVVSMSAAAAAGVLPRPVQSALDRVAHYAGWSLRLGDPPATTVMEKPKPTATTTTTDRLDATVLPTTPSVEVGTRATAGELCRAWVFGIQSRVAVEPNAMQALVVIAERGGRAVEQLCGPYTSTGTEAPTTQATPATVVSSLPPTGSTVSAPDAPAASAVAPPTMSKPTHPSNALPPQAHGNGPPTSEPGRRDHGENTNGDGNGPNSNASANANGNNNPNSSSGTNTNGNGNGKGDG